MTLIPLETIDIDPAKTEAFLVVLASILGRDLKVSPYDIYELKKYAH